MGTFFYHFYHRLTEVRKHFITGNAYDSFRFAECFIYFSVSSFFFFNDRKHFNSLLVRHPRCFSYPNVTPWNFSSSIEALVDRLCKCNLSINDSKSGRIKVEFNVGLCYQTITYESRDLHSLTESIDIVSDSITQHAICMVTLIFISNRMCFLRKYKYKIKCLYLPYVQCWVLTHNYKYTSFETWWNVDANCNTLNINVFVLVGNSAVNLINIQRACSLFVYVNCKAEAVFVFPIFCKWKQVSRLCSKNKVKWIRCCAEECVYRVQCTLYSAVCIDEPTSKLFFFFREHESTYIYRNKFAYQLVCPARSLILRKMRE